MLCQEEDAPKDISLFILLFHQVPALKKISCCCASSDMQAPEKPLPHKIRNSQHLPPRCGIMPKRHDPSGRSPRRVHDRLIQLRLKNQGAGRPADAFGACAYAASGDGLQLNTIRDLGFQVRFFVFHTEVSFFPKFFKGFPLSNSC